MAESHSGLANTSHFFSVSQDAYLSHLYLLTWAVLWRVTLICSVFSSDSTPRLYPINSGIIFCGSFWREQSRLHNFHCWNARRLLHSFLSCKFLHWAWWSLFLFCIMNILHQCQMPFRNQQMAYTRCSYIVLLLSPSSRVVSGSGLMLRI